VILAIIAGIIGLALFLLKGNRPDGSDQPEQRRGVPQPRSAAPGGRHRRRNRLADRMADEAEDMSDASSVELNSEEEAERLIEEEKKKRLRDGKRMGTKYLQKLEMKEEKRLAREKETKEREEMKKKKEEEWEERKQHEEAERQREEEEEKERQRLIEEQKKREEEEYQDMIENFDMGDEGEENTEDTMQREADLLTKFIDHIKSKKIVYLEELASNFSLKTADCVERIRALLVDETLTGVIDDRGKFIYVTKDEMQAVASFMIKQGRTSKTDLAKNSGHLINLEQS